MTVSRPSSPLPTKLTLAVLFCAMIALFSAMILLPDATATSAPAIDPALLSLPRAPMQAVNFLHGEGEEVVVDSYAVGDVVYTVGVTSSHTCDFTSAYTGDNLFVALASGGTVTRVKVWGDNGDDNCVGVKLGANELLVLASSSREPQSLLLYGVRYSDLAIEKRVLRVGESVMPIALYADGGEVVCVGQSLDQCDFFVFVLRDGAVQSYRIGGGSGVLRFCEIFPSPQGYDIIATRAQDGENTPVLFSQADEWRETVLACDGSEVLLDAIPCTSGFALLTQDGSQIILSTAMRDGTTERLATLPYSSRADLLPNGEGYFAALYDCNTYAVVTVSQTTTVALPACTLLSCALSEDGTPHFALAHSDGIGLFSTQGRVRELARIDALPPTAQTLVRNATRSAIFASRGALLFSTALENSKTEIGMIFF